MVRNREKLKRTTRFLMWTNRQTMHSGVFKFGKTGHDIGIGVKLSLDLVILSLKYLEDIHMELKVNTEVLNF